MVTHVAFHRHQSLSNPYWCRHVTDLGPPTHAHVCLSVLFSTETVLAASPLNADTISSYPYCFLLGVPGFSTARLGEFLWTDMSETRKLAKQLWGVNIGVREPCGARQDADPTHLFILRLDKTQSGAHHWKGSLFPIIARGSWGARIVRRRIPVVPFSKGAAMCAGPLRQLPACVLPI